MSQLRASPPRQANAKAGSWCELMLPEYMLCNKPSCATALKLETFLRFMNAEDLRCSLCKTHLKDPFGIQLASAELIYGPRQEGVPTLPWPQKEKL